MQTMNHRLDYSAMLAVAIAEARKGLAEGGIPSVPQFSTPVERSSAPAQSPSPEWRSIASRRNRRLSNAGRQRSYRNLIMVTTLAPCWYCSGLVRQFGFQKIIVGESRNFQGGLDWLSSLGIDVIDLNSTECFELLANYIRTNQPSGTKTSRRIIRRSALLRPFLCNLCMRSDLCVRFALTLLPIRTNFHNPIRINRTIIYLL